MNKDLKSLFGAHHGLDEKSVDFLTNALAKNNLPGFDYLEFKQSLSALTNVNAGMDDSTAIKSAFAMASTMGLTKDKLVKTANHYKAVLSKEKSQFDKALQKQMDQRVSGKLKEVEKLKKQIAQQEEQIKKLQDQIAKSQSTIDNADKDIQEAKDKIEGTKNNFEHTMQSILNQIDKDIETIQSTIG